MTEIADTLEALKKSIALANKRPPIKFGTKYNRYTRPSQYYKAEVPRGNPCFPIYKLTDDHGLVVATVDGSQFKAAVAKKFFKCLVDEAFHSGAELDLSELEETEKLDTLAIDD